MHLACVIYLTQLFTTSFASSGDRSPEFENCLTLCSSNSCHSPLQPGLPLDLRLTSWTCTDNCKYTCMHDITDREVERGEEIQQYYGKWPFWRFAGMQEPASVAFSMLNLWAHFRGMRKVKGKIPASHPMKPYYITWAALSINAWIWSFIFHTRDLPVTEKMDYFSAALAILYALYFTVIRLFHLYSPALSRPTIPINVGREIRVSKLWTFFCFALYMSHVTYLSLLPRFDYTYNIVFNLILGFSHNLLWLIYALPILLLKRFPSKPKSYRPSFVRKAMIFVLVTTGSTALELFDFPPWGRVIDAHALWHLSTAPIAFFWYDFLVEDARDSSWRVQEK